MYTHLLFKRKTIIEEQKTFRNIYIFCLAKLMIRNLYASDMVVRDPYLVISKKRTLRHNNRSKIFTDLGLSAKRDGALHVTKACLFFCIWILNIENLLFIPNLL